jgi:hypothetical protein
MLLKKSSKKGGEKIMKKILLAGLTVLTVAGAGTLATSAMAQETNGSNPMSNLVQKITDRFNLNRDEVQAVFDEARAEHQAERQATMAERLDQLVADGEITADQKELILAKHEELRTSQGTGREAMQDLTPEERRETMESRRQALQTWADENGIDVKYLLLGQHGPRGGPGGPGKSGEFGGPSGPNMNGIESPTESE